MTISDGTTWKPLTLDSIYDKLLLILDSGCIASPEHLPLRTNFCQFGVISMLMGYNALYLYIISYICAAFKNAESLFHALIGSPANALQEGILFLVFASRKCAAVLSIEVCASRTSGK